MNPEGDPPTRSFDWAEIHRRLERTTATVGEALQPSPERVQAVLEERARALARVPPAPPVAGEAIEVATFTLAGERYAVESCHVRRVLKLGEWTPVPGVPDVLVGVINFQGEILAVFDLQAVFGMPRRELSEQSCVIVLGSRHDEFGIVADAAHEVRALRIDQVHESPSSLDASGRILLRGVTADALIVLDGAALLRDDRFTINQADDSGS